MRGFLLLTTLTMICSLTVSVQSQDSCSSNLALSELSTYNLTGLNCASVWETSNFILRYKKNAVGLWTFVLSTPNPNSWVGIGFSENGRMVDASAVIGWPTSGTAVIKQYLLKGYTSSSVLADQGDLRLANATIVSKSSRLYLAFQLRVEAPLSNIIYAIGPDGAIPGSNYILQQHTSDISTALDYTTGQTSGGDSASTLQIGHGIINLLAWCVILPLGTMAARYFKNWDPEWFYAHLGFQITGFGLVIAGIVTGIRLEDQSGADVDPHKALGFIVLAMACLQATAVLARPKKSSKVRKYWNWYHHGVGRLAIAIAIGNTFYGISLGDAGTWWNVGVGIALAILGMTSVLLEIISCRARK